MTKIYMKENVFEAALNRIRYLFDEFEEVSVGFSGGKDSVVIFQLAMVVAKEKNRLPLSVVFLDQEAEWSYTIDIVKEVMYDPDVKPYWYQFPFLLDNATSFETDHLDCWGEGKEWIREKDPISIKENKYNHVDFGGMFTAIFKKDFVGKKHCHLAGVRTEESPGRFIGLTSQMSYKWITWGNKEAGDNHIVFYPIYDWSYTDVWKAIYENNWSYNEIYDYQYRYGLKIQNMRVSNLHHETAVKSLFYLQEVDKELYNKLIGRLPGVDMAGKMGFDSYFVKKLPFMFRSWREYREHLVEKIVKDKRWKKNIESFVKTHYKIYEGSDYWKESAEKVMVSSILTNDKAQTKLKNFRIVSRRYERDKKRLREIEEKNAI